MTIRLRFSKTQLSSYQHRQGDYPELQLNVSLALMNGFVWSRHH